MCCYFAQGICDLRISFIVVDGTVLLHGVSSLYVMNKLVPQYTDCSNIDRAVIAQSVSHWATDWTIRVLGFDSQWGLGILLFTTASRMALGPT
jgi:hypothetical protein